MTFLFVIYSFYLFNISFFVQAQDCSSFNYIECKEKQYYNSMTCQCEECDSSLINENICYKIENEKIKSIYDPNITIFCKNEEGEKIDCSKLSTNGNHFTELDSEGKWLGFLMPARNYITKDDIDKIDDGLKKSIEGYSFTFRLYSLSNSDTKKPELGESQTIGDIPADFRDSIIYYYSSCIHSYYDSSCNILANLCVVAMYNRNNGFCKMIEELSNNMKLPTL